MDVIVDHDRNVALEGDLPDLLAAIAAVHDLLKARGRAVLSLKIDGKEIQPSDLPLFEGRTLDSAGTLEVTSEAVATLVGQALRELDEVLPELPKACLALAEVFQSSQPAEGYAPFERLAEIWVAVKDREQQIASLSGVELDDLSVGGIPSKSLHEGLNQYLREAASALETGDCVLLGDLLAYELAPRADAELKLVNALRKRVESTAGAL